MDKAKISDLIPDDKNFNTGSEYGKEWANEETFLTKEERDMDFLAIGNKFKTELFEYA